MLCLVDTSILVRLANAEDPSHAQAVGAIAALWQAGDSLHVAPQNLVEFWSVATRPLAANGLGLSVADAAAILDVYQAEFVLLPETAALFAAWRAVLNSVEVLGKQAHDARLAAHCHVHAIDSLLTFNVRHFARFTSIGPGLKLIEPAAFSNA
jgi:predicted nucleic acid-binding protein